MKRILLISAGSLAVFLAVLGIFLPVLPTTPFLLLAAACYLRSSAKLHKKLMNHPVFGTYIRNYQEYRAVPLRTKITALLMMWGGIGFSISIVPLLPVRIGLALVAVGVTVHILRLRTLTPELQRELEARSRDDCCA